MTIRVSKVEDTMPPIIGTALDVHLQDGGVVHGARDEKETKFRLSG
jgi:hypothetical protein